MLCVISVYLRDITNTIFVILHMNVSSEHLLLLFLFFLMIACSFGVCQLQKEI